MDIKNMMKNIKIYRNAIWVKDFLHRFNIKPLYLIISASLSLGAAIFEGISVAFLVPLVQGIITMDFSFVKHLPVLKITIFKFPKIFTASNTTIFILLVGIVFVSAILKNIMQYLATISVSRQFRKLSSNLRKLIFNHYLSYGKLFFDQNNIGYLHNVLLDFTAFIAVQLKELGVLLTQLFTLAVYIVLMFIISWKLTIFTLIIFPILNYVSNWLIKKIEKTSQFHTESYIAISKKISNILMAISLVKLYTAEEREKEHFSSMSEGLEKLEFSIDKKSNLITPAQEMIMLIGILFLVSVMAFIVIKDKSRSIGSFMMFFYILKKSQGVVGALSRIKSSFAVVSGPILAISKILDKKDKPFITDGQQEFTGLKDKIQFNHLNFSYKEGVEVIKDITFSIEKGKMTAIVGPTGTGKTTLVNLTLRLYECPPSSILIDGVDIRKFTLKSLLGHIAFVGQDTLLFNETLRNNIIYGLNNKVSDEKLIDVVSQARLYDFIMSLPDGFDTNIGDRGVKLSGGERQRVSIARALLKDADILIFDEATSSLDTRTEKLIQEAIDEAIKNRTVIVIAHRLSTIQHADKVVVIENGSLVEEGSLKGLLEKKGKFYEYWQEQKFY